MWWPFGAQEMMVNSGVSSVLIVTVRDGFLDAILLFQLFKIHSDDTANVSSVL